MRRFARAVCFLSLGGVAAMGLATAHADDAKPAEGPETVAVEKGPFTVVVDSSGVFEPVGAVEVSVEPEVYGGDWKVVESFSGPGPVEAGQTLVRFDTDKIDEQIALAEKDYEIATRALAQRREDGKRAEEASAVALAQAEQEKNGADERLRTFLATEKDLRIKESEQSLRRTRDWIQDQQEELEQLRKMYKSDDVVEETEEIVMKRAERALERAKTELGFGETRQKTMLEVDLPREQREMELGVRRTALALDKLRATSGAALEQGRIDLAKAEVALDRQKIALDRLHGDHDRFLVKAPVAGVAVPGSCVKGKWSNVDETARGLQKGKVVGAKTVIFTIVKPGAVAFRTPVPEASILSMRPGEPVELTAAALGAAVLAGKIERVAPTGGDGNFDVVVSLEKGDERLFPGFAGKAKTVTERKSEAVTVPASAVATDGDKKLVHVVGADLKPTAKTVKVGATSGGRVEILDGLAGGERVLKTAPKP